MRTAAVQRTFTDLKENILRKKGDVFSVSDKRAEELEAKGLVKLEPKAVKKKEM